MATTPGMFPNNLPSQVSSFLGREREIAENLQRLMHHRLLTLTGPGGCGKTRLALKIASELVTAYADGVWLIEFAPLTNPAFVPQAVATALGVSEQPGRALLDTLVDHLRPRTVLLVLDNCEHLVAACASLVDCLLHTCPTVRILATSSEPLGVRGEVTWLIPPLSLPPPQPWRSPSSGQDALPIYLQSEAVRLFVERAAAVAPGFTLTTENGAWVAEICRRLDGIPLAIELAAARLRVLSVRQIAERLDDRFTLLTSGSRTAPPRQQTLAAALDWSYSLLTRPEQTVLQRLAVFAGSCTLEAAEAVCQGPDIAPDDVLSLLTRLVEKSLVMVQALESHNRYKLLETVQQYAWGKLAARRETALVRTRHLEWLLHWAEQAAPHLTGPQYLAWLRQFEAEHDNLRVALEWSAEHPDDADKALHLAAACGRFWRLRGYLSEGRLRLAAALAQTATRVPTVARAWAFFWAALLAYLQSDYSASRALCEETLAVTQVLGSAANTAAAEAVTLLGQVATEEGDYATAARLLDEALVRWRALGDPLGIGDALLQLGWAAMRRGDYAQATAYLEESLVLLRQGGYVPAIALNLAGLGEAAIRQGAYTRAIHLLEESLALRREIGDKWGIGTALGSLGWVALCQHDFARMRVLLRASIEIRREIGDRSGIAWCLEKLAEGALRQAQTVPQPGRRPWYGQAVQAFAAAAALRAPLDSAIDPADQVAYELNLAKLRTALGTEAWAAAWAAGEAAALPDAIDHALGAPEAAGELPPSPTDQNRLGGLTPRERETAALVAQGKSNRAIAQAMTVREKTVETYITRILNKLGFDSRVQIAVWAAESGLRPPPDRPSDTSSDTSSR